MRRQPIWGDRGGVAGASIRPRAAEYRARFGSPLCVSALVLPHVHGGCLVFLPNSFAVQNAIVYPFAQFVCGIVIVVQDSTSEDVRKSAKI